MGNGNKVEMLIAVCAVVSSIAAVFIAWDQGRVMRSQEKADVWPMIQITHQTDFASETPYYAINVQNAGVGPALVEDFVIVTPDGALSRDVMDMPRALMPDEGVAAPGIAYANLRGRVIRQGDELDAIVASWSDADATMIDLLAGQLDAFVTGQQHPPVMFVCYCSILEDCWVTSTQETQVRPDPIKSCAIIDDTARTLMTRYPR